MEKACPWIDDAVRTEEVVGQPAFLTIGFVIHLPEANMGSPGRDSEENSRQVVHGPVTACKEERNSKIRPQDIQMGTYRNHLWHAVFNSFQRNKRRFINRFFRRGSIGCSFRLRVPKAGAHVLNEDLRLWGTVKSSKVNCLTWPVRYLRQRRERTLLEVESRIGSIPDNSVRISAPN